MIQPWKNQSPKMNNEFCLWDLMCVWDLILLFLHASVASKIKLEWFDSACYNIFRLCLCVVDFNGGQKLSSSGFFSHRILEFLVKVQWDTSLFLKQFHIHVITFVELWKHIWDNFHHKKHTNVIISMHKKRVHCSDQKKVVRNANAEWI